MKKTLLIAACGLFAASTYAQQVREITPDQKATYQSRGTYDASTSPVARNAQAVESAWLNWGIQIESFHEDEPSQLWVGTLWPDSNIYSGVNTSNELVTPFVHKIATTVVPSDPNWEWMSPYNTAIIDSLAVQAEYTRSPGTPEDQVDILRFEVVKSISQTFQTQDASGNPTSVFVGLTYDQPNNQTTQSDVIETIDVELTADDDTGGELFSFDVNAADHVIAATNDPNAEPGVNYSIVVSFIPGDTSYELANTDSIGMANFNRFNFGTLEEYGNNTTPEDYLTYNMSYILPTDVRYDLSPEGEGNWNGNFVPSSAYNQPGWWAENHLIFAKLTSNDINVTENEEVAFNVYPNPSNGLVTVVTNYNGAKAQTINVKNVLGQEVINMTSTQANEELNLSTFGKGVYFVTVNNGVNQVTKKVTVQ